MSPVQGNENKIQDRHMVAVLFSLCWIVYFITYIGRLNYSSAMPALIADGLLSRTQAGSAGTAFFFAYGGGQFLNGMLADRLPPRWMIFAGLAASSAANLCIGFSASYGTILLFWGING